MTYKWQGLLVLVVLAGWTIEAPCQAPEATSPADHSAGPPIQVLPGDGPADRTIRPTGLEVPLPPAILYAPGQANIAAPATVAANPCNPPPGWFASVEGILSSLHTRSSGFFGDGDRDVDLDLTVSPIVTLGYRFASGHAVLLSYRFLTSQVSQSDGSGDFHGEVENHWLDLTYLSRPYNPIGDLRLQWETGARLAWLKYNTHEHFNGVLFGDPSSGWDVQHDRSIFAGGPHIGFDPSWWFGQSGIALFGKVDLGILLGTGEERYDSGSKTSQTKGIIDTRSELGLSWTLPWQSRWVQIAGGYQVENSLWLGRTYTDEGPFLRCELAF